MIDGELPVPARGLLTVLTALNVHFRSYLLAGGIPGMANQFAASNTIPDETFERYEEALRDDALHAGLRHDIVARMLPAVARSVGSPVSWAAIKGAAAARSHRVVEGHARALSDMLLLHVIYRCDLPGGAPRRNVPKKVYFQDPFYFNMAKTTRLPGRFARAAAAVDDEQAAGRAAEQAVACHVVRMASAMGGRAGSPGHRDTVFYWKSKRGREVDFVVRAGGRLAPIEVKWQGRVRRGDMYGIFDFRRAASADGGGIVLSRDEARERHGLVVVPAAVFALLAA